MTAIARTDLGPSVRPDARGRLRSSGPGAVVVEFRTDPTNPADRALHRGARRASILLRLYAQGSISRPQLAAAHRLVDDMALAHGVTHRTLYAPCRPSGACTRPDPLPRQLDALRRVRAARDALRAAGGYAIVWWVVVRDLAIEDFERANGIPYARRRGTQMLHDALTTLGKHYGVIDA